MQRMASAARRPAAIPLFADLEGLVRRWPGGSRPRATSGWDGGWSALPTGA